MARIGRRCMRAVAACGVVEDTITRGVHCSEAPHGGGGTGKIGSALACLSHAVRAGMQLL
eukprot:IDg23863t1